MWKKGISFIFVLFVQHSDPDPEGQSSHQGRLEVVLGCSDASGTSQNIPFLRKSQLFQPF